MFNAFVGYYEMDREAIKKFQGFDFETGSAFWRKSLAAYLETDDEETLCRVEDKARVIGYMRMIRRSIRRNGLDSETGRAEIECWTKELLALIDRVDSLTF